MARLWNIGFELNSVTDGIEYINAATAGVGTIETTTIRSGTYGIKVTAAGVSSSWRFDQRFVAADGNGPYYARMYFRVNDAPDAIQTTMTFINDAGAVKSRIRINSDRTLELWDVSAQIGSDSSALNLDQWYLLELSFFNNTVSGKTEMDGRINGVSFASTTTGTNTGGASRFFAPVGGGATNYTYYADDIAINDSSGSFQNSWPGEGEIIHLRPNANGDTNQWQTDGAGYDVVNEVTPDDATNSNYENTLNEIDEYNLDATPAALASDDTISCVAVGVRFRTSNATGSDPAFVLRIKAAAAGTVEESSATTCSLATWSTNQITGATPTQNYRLVLYDLPGASTTAWTKADLDTTQIGMRVSTGDTHLVDISTIWLVVDHKPTAGGGGGAAIATAIMTTNTSFWGY